MADEKSPPSHNGRNNDTGKQKPVMSAPEMRAYRVAVAVAFGLIGFGVNFLDIEFLKGATFKISILAGLFFPLVVALAWGWRYGLLSALAGGCQTMWWLWHGDGWGVFYAVPVFTLWIVWHGWWAERRTEGHPWYVSSFAVEVPFRIIIEMGFLVVFRWLVSLNPPPWNPAISWDQMSSAWLQTVAIKHVVTAYILLTAAYVALSLGPVRRFFGLPPRPAQRDTTAIYAGAALFGLLLWTLDALVDYLFFPREGQTFWGIAVHGASGQEVFMRSVYIAAAMLAGVLLTRLNRRRAALQELLDHRNRVLAAIRNVNQLIVREKNPLRLLDEACRLLVGYQGYYNAWIILMADGLPREPFSHAGFNGDFAPMAERLRAGEIPNCAQAALSSDGVQVKDDLSAQCSDCPLSSSYAGRAGLSLRIEHAGRIFGWMSLSCHAKYARSKEEHDLLMEVAGDIAFALWAIEAETQRETLAGKYAAVLATTSDAVVADDLDGRIAVFNPGAEKLFGCSADAVMGSPITHFCPDDRLEEQAEMMRRVRETGAIPGYETERLTADGRRVPVEIALSLNSDAQGRPLGINAILRDITERKQAEEALKESEGRLRSTLDGLSSHIAVLDEQGEIILTNKAYRDFGEQNGVVPGDVSEGVNYLAVCDTASGGHSEEARPFADGIREVLSGKLPYFGMEYPCHSPDEKLWFFGRVTPSAGNGPRRVIVAHENISERKQAEDALQASEEKYRLLIDNLNEGVWQIDKDGYTVFVNDRMAEMLGHTVQEMQGKHLFDFMDEQEAQLTKNYMQRRQEGIKEQHEHILVCKDGSCIFTSLETSPVYDKDGKYIGALAGVQDVTARKRAEEALRRSENYYRAIFETSGTAMLIIEEDTTISQINTNFETLSGYSKQEVEGKKSWSEFVHAGDVGWIKQYHYLRRRKSDASPRQYEFRFITRHGEKRNILLAVDMIAGTNRSIASCIDITERKQAEEAITASEEKYRSILDSIEDGYFEVDTAGNFTFFNDSMCRTLGYSGAELMGMNNREFMDKENAEKVFQAFNQVFTTGASLNLHFAL